MALYGFYHNHLVEKENPQILISQISTFGWIRGYKDAYFKLKSPFSWIQK